MKNINATFRSEGSRGYMRLGIRKVDRYLFNKIIQIEIIYNGESIIKDITNRLFQEYGEMDHPVFRKWSRNLHSNVIIDISELNNKRVVIKKITPH